MGAVWSFVRKSNCFKCMKNAFGIDEPDNGVSVSINCACFHSKTIRKHNEEKTNVNSRREDKDEKEGEDGKKRKQNVRFSL